MVMLICLSALLLGAGGAAFILRARHGLDAVIVILGTLVLVVPACFYLVYRRLGVHYRIAGGRLSEISGAGVTRWEEDLHGLVSVSTPSYFKGPTVLRMKWPSHTREIELLDSLCEALYPE